jgi:putative ABC transport system permease protein
VSYVDIPLHRLAIAAVLIAVAVALSRWNRLSLEKDLLWGALRGAVQLIAIGHVLLLLFRHERPEWVLIILVVMVLAAGYTSARRVSHGPPWRKLLPFSLVALSLGAAVALLPVFLWVVPIHPWFNARYVIPLAGMMLSNAMNVVALVFERIFSSAHDGSEEIEQMLALGASPSQAIERHARAAVRAAMIPTINGLLTVGLVALPGMMTGQILSGTAPEQAVRYQIVVMYQLVAVASVAGVVAVSFARRMLFTPRAQLLLPGTERV